MIRRIERGPTVTRIVFDHPAEARGIRLELPVWGEDALAIEIPRPPSDRETVRLDDLLKKGVPKGCTLPLFIGRDSSGQDLVVDLAVLPQLLIGGENGQGKTTLINSLMAGLRASLPQDGLRFVCYDRCHVDAFFPLMREMFNEVEHRLKMFAQVNCRNISEYNERGSRVPCIVVVVDEIMDLIARLSDDDIRSLSCTLARARAAGMHWIISTSCPSCVPEAIKANIPGRIAFWTANENDSRLILDESGAENMLGHGDMLMRLQNGRLVRAQAAVNLMPEDLQWKPIFDIIYSI